jgi:hypothetical protein
MTFYKKIAMWTLAAGMCVGSLNAYAGEDVIARKIVDFGCQNNNGTCFVDLDGAAFGASLGCPTGATNQFRFDNSDTAVGKRTLAAFMAAYLSGKHVAVHLEGCSSQGYPTITYFYIMD